ncbi:putative lipoprotein YerB [Paenibacillus faecis]|uniref:DUF3048 domain-containing protein n=1 Tax=Paenibacillus faecis TaxID=862114 RepID=UPI001B29D2A4|nr:DUF3048 domain-containing protein [Paenibacillus faecis]GIO87017.1 putative lipoprotein YerB [Paenibacillus faecis]
MNLNLIRNSFVLLLLSICLIALPACGTAKSPPAAEEPAVKTVTVEEEPPVSEERPAAAYTAPLTGMPLNEPLTRRPLAVMINNAPAARPQSGLGGADIVYEVLAEGGVTRLVSIFHSRADEAKIGPIRSIRPYMIELGESYHGVLVHAGASNDAYAILQRQKKEDLDEITNAGAYFWRDKSRKAPHNLYSNVEKLLEGAAKRKYKTEDTSVPTYSFLKEGDLVAGDSANSVEIKFQLDNYKVTYKYDATTQLYQRYVNGSPHNDRETGEILTAANVVVLGADHKVLDDVGRLSVDLELGGQAVLFQRGKMIRGQWIHRPDDVIRFVKDNQEVPFAPGTTYFNVVPNQPDFDSHLKVE